MSHHSFEDRWAALKGPHGDNAALYEQTLSLMVDASFPSYELFAKKVILFFLEQCKALGVPQPHVSIVAQMAGVATSVYVAEELTILPANPADYNVNPNHPAIGGLRDRLLLIGHKAKHATETLALISDALIEGFLVVARQLPKVAHHGDPQGDTLLVPLVALLPNSGRMLERFIEPFTDKDAVGRGFFQTIGQKLDRNAERAARRGRPVPLSEFEGALRDAVTTYLDDTPLATIFLESEVPFKVPDGVRKEHTLIVAPAGAGKTTLLQQIVLNDLAENDPPPMVIVDPKGLLVDRISRLDVFNPHDGRLRDRLVIFDPDDQPSLNMFDVGQSTPQTRQPVQNQIIGNFGYIFSASGFKLTPKQQVDFSYVVRLLFSIPNATILTLLDILDDPAREISDFGFAPEVAGLDTISRRFFQNDFFTEFKDSKAQIKARLYMILQHPEVAASLSAATSSIDLAACLAERKIILVNTGMTSLGADASTLLGRYFISLTLSAAFARMKQGDTSFASIIVDEYQEFADELKTPEIMRLAREYNLGLTVATQTIHGSPFTDNLRTSISTNTSIKYASSPEGTDINYVARDLRCDTEFLRAQTKTATHGKFACFVRGLLEQPVSITVPFGNIQKEPQMTPEQFTALRKANKDRLSASPEPTRPASEPKVQARPKPDSAPAVRTDDPDAGEHTEAATKWGE